MAEKRQRTVLLVERDNHVCDLVTHFLAEAELNVDCLTDGYAALDRARRERPPLVITDILIPALDGLALCRLIKRDDSARDKVMVLTVLSAEQRAFESGADASMKKPIEKETLVATVRSLLEEQENQA